MADVQFNTSLYLSQSYQDAWDDYQRSLKSWSFPVWDYVIVTASNEHQADGSGGNLRAERTTCRQEQPLRLSRMKAA